jgi:2-C-methyl-D-erythritol 4-phosphate cytidylyltransferase
MGFDKLFAALGPKPVLAHSLQAFEDSSCIAEVIVVTSAERYDDVTALKEQYRLSKIKAIVHGGRDRHHSVQEGLRQMSEDCTMIAVHDGARPLICLDDIQRCADMAAEHGAAACARKITETVKRADANRRVTGSIDRSNLWATQTPQIFHRELLLRAYQAVEAQNLLVTDEVSAVEALNQPIMLCQCTRPNLKITFPQDLEVATRLLEQPKTATTANFERV